MTRSPPRLALLHLRGHNGIAVSKGVILVLAHVVIPVGVVGRSCRRSWFGKRRWPGWRGRTRWLRWRGATGETQAGHLRGGACGCGFFALFLDHCGFVSDGVVVEKGYWSGSSGKLTVVDVRLLSDVIIGVAVSVNRAIKLLVGHEGVDELVVGVEQAAQPLLVLDIVDLG